MTATNNSELGPRRARRESSRIAGFFGSRTVFAMILAIMLFSLTAASGSAALQSKAQKKAEAQLRTVHGSVIDKAENPVPSAVIYLKNLKTQAVKTYIADEAGNYRYSGLDPNADYEIHAEHDGLASATRTVSSFDSRRDIEVVLKLTHKKS